MGCEERGYRFQPVERSVTRGFGVRKQRGFTGKRGDRHYYRGRRWLGATNAVGCGSTFTLIKIAENVFGLAPSTAE